MPEASDKQKFKKLCELSEQVEVELRSSRCCACEHLSKGKCKKFNVAVTDEHKFTLNECEGFMLGIPF